MNKNLVRKRLENFFKYGVKRLVFKVKVNIFRLVLIVWYFRFILFDLFEVYIYVVGFKFRCNIIKYFWVGRIFYMIVFIDCSLYY